MLGQENANDYGINTINTANNMMHDPSMSKNKLSSNSVKSPNNIDIDTSDWQTVKTKKKTKVIVKGKQQNENDTDIIFNAPINILSDDVDKVISASSLPKPVQISISPTISVTSVTPVITEIPVINKEVPILLSDNDLFDKIDDDNVSVKKTAQYTDIERGDHLKFKNKWKVFVHKAESVDWSIDSFEDDYYIVDSVGTFLQFFSNFYKLNSKQYNFFIMKSQPDQTFVEPTWEHEQNRGGGICSIRIDSLHGVELMQQLCLLMMNNLLIPNMDIINGISYGVKTNWALIKIWTNDKVEDISKLLPSAVVSGYNNINIRYKQNVPEY